MLALGTLKESQKKILFIEASFLNAAEKDTKTFLAIDEAGLTYRYYYNERIKSIPEYATGFYTTLSDFIYDPHGSITSTHPIRDTLKKYVVDTSKMLILLETETFFSYALGIPPSYKYAANLYINNDEEINLWVAERSQRICAINFGKFKNLPELFQSKKYLLHPEEKREVL